MSQANALEQLMLTLINQERAIANLPPLTFNGDLNEASEDHSVWMLEADTFSHTGQGGSSAGDRIVAAGYRLEGRWSWGENIGWQSERGDPGLEDDVRDIHLSLMNSPGHRANILNPNFDEIGIGIERGDFYRFDSVMITQNFGLTDAPPSADLPDSGPNRLDGDVGSNFLVGGTGLDLISGLGGDDTLDGGAGADTMNGGPGSDEFFVDDAGDIVLESARWSGFDVVNSTVSFRMGRQNIEELRLIGEDAIVGAGSGTANHIIGSVADNTLDGGKGVDTLEGGLGNDTFIIRSPGDNAVEAAGEGIDTVKAFRGHKLEANVERLFLQNLLTKNGDPVQGLNAIGNELDNVIVGNAVDNFIAGDLGNDVLNGNLGNDTFMFVRAASAENADRVVDFNVRAGDSDSLLFASAAYTALTPGGLAATALHLGTSAAGAEDRFIFDQTSGNLWYDEDGTGAAAQQLVAFFDGGITLSADDFQIV